MSTQYEVFIDEAWTQSSKPLKRYWCFYGGIFGTQGSLDALEKKLDASAKRHGLRTEVKWGHISQDSFDAYVEFVDLLLTSVGDGDIKYRQVFLDRSYVWIPQHSEEALGDLDSQFRICYQFIKHSFGLRYLPPDPDGADTRVSIRLDNHSSQQHKERLTKFCKLLPDTLGRKDLDIAVSFHNSKKIRRLQVCDLLMGAAGSHGNKMHQVRLGGRRGMSAKQKVRHNFCKYVYERLKEIDASSRGSKAFNWFETTGLSDDPANRYAHPMRIWKFKPKYYKRDLGWENNHLDKEGHYVGPDIR